MKPIDFDRRFQLFALDWLKRHPGLKEDEIDARYNEMLAEWRDQPADWLGGSTPGAYFQQFDNAEELAALIVEYDRAGIELPEPLYSRIVELGEASVEPLMAILEDGALSEKARAQALSILGDIGTDAPLGTCAKLVARAEEAGDLVEAAARRLEARVVAARELLLDALDGATDYGRQTLIDLLSNLPGDARACELALYGLANDSERRAFYAACLGKIGDPRAIEALQRVAELADLSYYDYMEIVNAVEMLGGEMDPVREFYGDPDYETLRFSE